MVKFHPDNVEVFAMIEGALKPVLKRMEELHNDILNLGLAIRNNAEATVRRFKLVEDKFYLTHKRAFYERAEQETEQRLEKTELEEAQDRIKGLTDLVASLQEMDDCRGNRFVEDQKLLNELRHKVEGLIIERDREHKNAKYWYDIAMKVWPHAPIELRKEVGHEAIEAMSRNCS